MSSRQFTPFGGSGEIVTLDNINEYDDLPPLAEIDSPDVYEIRTGALGTDYLVPMQDGSTDFNEWYSLVDGQIILDIPDIVGLGSQDDNGYIHLIDDGSLKTTLSDPTNNAAGIEITEEYTYLASEDSNIYVYETGSWELITTLTEAGSASTRYVAANDEYVAYHDYFGDDNVYVHNISDWSLEYELMEATDTVSNVDINSGYVFYSSFDDRVYVHDLSDGSLVEESLTSDSVNFISASESKYCYDNGTDVDVRSIGDWNEEFVLTQSSDGLNGGSITSDFVAYGGTDENVYVHDVSDGSLVQTLSESGRVIQDVELSENNIIYGGDDDVGYLHTVSDWSLSQELTEAEREIFGVSILE